MLFTIWAKPAKGRVKAYIGVDPFTEFFSLRRPVVEKRIGPEGWRTFTAPAFAQFLKAVKDLVLIAQTPGDNDA